ncbi:hypothetical protein FGG08_006090 [Glutinoglossum americanum]|uniref:C2H2-type domain-containing protein n=1 Tax=Glutinoglossum americanum TaxID=1670608 RepID=A0A9P8I298_9PEZI|nr:hypothetical protein FGG08_006090 [Glutinoglossum americanum]
MASSHLRRRSKAPQSPKVTPPEEMLPVPRTSSRNGVPLRRVATFNSPTTSPSEIPRPLPIPSCPKRSETCPKDLDVIAGSEARMAALIGTLDRSLSCSGSMSPGVRETLHQEALPLPRIVLDATVSEPSSQVGLAEMDRASNESSEAAQGASPRQRQNPDAQKHHTSDSGIGSTVSGTVRTTSENGDDSETLSSNRSGLRRAGAGACLGSSVVHLSPARIPNAGSKPSAANMQSPHGRHIRLSHGAKVQMLKHIIYPLLKQKSLKHFHPLLREAPQRIGHGEIICLRDLEKYLIHLAQTRAKSVPSYLEFCEMSIHCVQDTVNSISESEQRRPYDRPYTDGYFVDLVDQIRQYAREVNASKMKRAAGEEAGELDCSPYVFSPKSKANTEISYRSEKLVLQGGLSQTGRPAELVRVKNGKTIRIGTDTQSLKSGGQLTEEESKFRAHIMKRQLSEHSSDEEFDVHRSMARRRKVSQAAKEMPVQVCEECGKQFKRPCDLTSKRESNCKQHMEKAHGWEYVRSKKTRGMPTGRPSAAESHTPEATEIPTPISSVGVTTPMTRVLSYGNDPHGVSPGGYSVAGSISGSDGDASYGCNVYEEPQQPSYPTQQEAFSFNDYPSTFNQNGAYIQPYIPPETIVDHASASNANAVPGPLEGSLISSQPSVPNVYDAIDWSSLSVYCDNIHTFQLLTPDNSAGQTVYDSFDLPGNPYQNASCSGVTQQHAPHIVGLSPGAQGNMVLYSPESGNEITDEGYDEFLGSSGKPINDFQLFPSGASGSSHGMNEGMFPTFRQPMNVHGMYPPADPAQNFDYIPWEDDSS